MRLSLSERETIVVFNELEQTASLDTCNAALIRRLDGFVQKSTAITVVREDEYSKRYHLPKSWIKVQMPRQLSSEQRQKLREKAQIQFSTKNRNGGK